MTFTCPPSYCNLCGSRLSAYERVYQVCLWCAEVIGRKQGKEETGKEAQDGSS